MCGGVGGGGVYGEVGGWRAHGWVRICTHTTQKCWVLWMGGHTGECGYDGWVVMMCDGWDGVMGGGWSKAANIRNLSTKLYV